MKYSTTLLLVVVALLPIGCYNYLEKPRPIVMKCPVEKEQYLKSAINIFQENGYKLVELDTAAGVIMVQDSITEVAYRYTALVRTWRIEHKSDSVVVQVWSVSSRVDGSDIKQTWDKRWSDEIVKEWMRPVLTALETTCGLGSPLRPR